MKLAMFDDFQPGVLLGSRISNIASVVGNPVMREQPASRMAAIIEDFEQLRGNILDFAAHDRGIPLSEVKLRAPLPRPEKMLFAQGNYRENVAEGSMPLNMFLKAPSSIIGPGETIVLSDDDAVIFHHEAELAPVIGRRARHVSSQEALDYVFGYTGLIDVSARCAGRGQDLADKSPDTFCPLGPWIVTRDEIPDPQKLSVRLWVDGALRQDYSTDDMEHPVRDLIAWTSSVLTLEPGDVLGCGTNHQGLGPLQDAETVSMEIESIGRMDFKVVDPLKRRWPVGIDRGIGPAVVKLRCTGVRPPPTELFSVKRIG